jgi:hypothetical protein
VSEGDPPKLDGAGGPYITQSGNNAVSVIYVSPWVNLETAAKGDKWLSLFYRENSSQSIIQFFSVALQVR